jgi:hypothetical protein
MTALLYSTEIPLGTADFSSGIISQMMLSLTGTRHYSILHLAAVRAAQNITRYGRRTAIS